MGEFKGKVVVVTGGSRGIGHGIAVAFAREGAQTVLASSSEQNLTAAANAVAAQGASPVTVAGDLRTLAALGALFRRGKQSFGCGRSAHACGLRATIPAREREFRALRRPGEQRRCHARRQLSRPA